MTAVPSQHRRRAALRAAGRRLLGKLRRGWRERAGGVFIYTAIAAPVAIGFAGLSIDVGMWYANKRLAQSAADSAAMAASLEALRSDGDSDAIEAAAILDAANHGYSAGNGDTVTVNPLSGSRVEVVVSRPSPGLLSQVVFSEPTTVAARAVARSAVNDSCVWSLNPTIEEAVSVNGAANVELGCGVIANSGDADGLHQEGSGCLSASSLKVVGDYTADCTLDPPPVTGVPPVDDPLAALESPSVGTCDYNGNDAVFNSNTGGPIVLNPGVYCGNGIKVNTTRPVTFNPGLYILDNAPFTINGQADVSGTDVSFYLTPGGSPNDDITIAGGASVTLSAPSDGPLPGILFYHDRVAGSNITHNLTGGSDMQLEGIVYFPSTDVQFSGGSTVQSSGAVIIADEVGFSGDAFLGGFDTSPILGNPLLIRAELVE